MIVKKFDSGRGHLVCAAVTALFALVCAQAQASVSVTGTPTARSKSLRFRSASLDNPAGVQELYSRLRLAAKQMCAQPGDEARNGRAATTCEHAALETAVASVDRESLTALHRARTRQAPVVNARMQSPTPCKQCG